MVAAEDNKEPQAAAESAASAEPLSASAAAHPAASHPGAASTDAGTPEAAVRPPQPDAASAEQTHSEQKAGHKRKVALFMAYIGEGYVVRSG